MSNEISISRTKIIVPVLRPEVIHRARLLALFDDLIDKKLIIVAAPAGYGKTTLLVDFARQSEMPVCWLSLDRLDKDPQRFIVYFIAALAEKFHGFGTQSSAVLRSMTNLEHDSERLLATLVNEIDSQIDEHFVLILDDYQFVDIVPFIRDFFSRFVYLVGENCHVVLSSRRLPTLPDITLMVARQQVGGFDLEQLAFRQNEICTLFETNYGVKLTDEAAEELMRQTEGWITGLHLSTSKAAHGVPDLARAAHATGIDLHAYLDQQVFRPQLPKVRKFLLQTSLMDEFDADLCEKVLGKGDWKNLIKTVRQNNLFVLPVGTGGKWIRYHHLFQEFLQDQFHQEDPEEEWKTLLGLAHVYESRLEWEKAYAIYKQIGEYELLAGLIERAGIPMLLNERLITFQGWLDELPHSLLHEHPILLSHKGALLCAQGDGYLAKENLDLAITEFRQKSDLPDLATALVRRSAASHLLGEYADSLRYADEAIQLADSKSALKAVYADAKRFKGIDLNLLGRGEEAIECLRNALKIFEQLGEKQSIARVQVELGTSYRAIGNYSAAHDLYARALKLWHSENNLFSQASVLNNMGVLYYSQGEYEQAVRAFEAGLDYARKSNSPWREALLMASLGDVYTDLDEYESANRSYSSAIEIVRRVNYQFLSDYLGLAKARLARLRGRYKDARLALDEATPFIQTANSNYESGLLYMEYGCLQVMEEKTERAVSDLEKAVTAFQAGGLTVDAASARVWLATVYLASGDIKAARSHLQAALGNKPPEKALNSLVQTVRQARPRLTVLCADQEIGPQLTTWMEIVAQSEKRLPSLRKRLRRMLTTIPLQAPQLTIRAFGKAQVRVNGKTVTSAQWKTASVRELFFYFLSSSHPVTKEEIGAFFWPDITSKQLKLRFKNNLYRLRHALGLDVILFEDDHYHFNRFLDYEYDIEVYSMHLQKAKDARIVEDKIAHLRDATALRTGVYLQDMDTSWIWQERERLEQSHMEALRQLIDLYRKIGDSQSALLICQEALKIDPCREDIHCLAMQLHADRGDRLAVIWQYQACRKALQTELDLLPSDTTESLYRQLIA